MKCALLSAALVFLIGGCTITPPPISENPSASSSSAFSASSALSAFSGPQVIATNLRIPWDIAFLPSGEMLVTERPGTLLRIGTDQKKYPIEGVRHVGEGGLLGVVLHPDFSQNHWIYLYFTTGSEGISNRVERYTFRDDTLSERTEILGSIPGSVYHDGGRMAFGPDGLLYITTGDAGNSNAAQDTQSLAGKILRIRDDGSTPTDNPFGNAVYSYGHRNPQGLAWDSTGQLWSTEHGRSGAASGYDELNRIDKGGNYGWPIIQGSETRAGMTTPFLHSGPTTTWAPASALFLDGKIFFGGLRGESLYKVSIADGKLKEYFHGEFGRIRTVTLGPDGMLYLTTSNTDGRGNADAQDDRIITVDPKGL